jgi:hypothetical protein
MSDLNESRHENMKKKREEYEAEIVQLHDEVE